LFSYLDTQLSRLGSPNFHQLPINAPKCPFANQQRDGQMQMQVPKGRVSYDPSSLAADSARETPRSGFVSAAVNDHGDKEQNKGRLRPASFADHYSQARQFYSSQTQFEQTHIASALAFELSKVDTLHVRAAMVGHLRHIDADLAQRVADALALEKLPPAPPSAVPVQNFKPSPALRTIGKMKPSLDGRTVAILVADGSDGATITSISQAVRAAGATVKIVAPKVGGAKLADGTLLSADGQLSGTPSVMFDAVALVLSREGAETLSQDAAAVDFVRDAYGHLKAIAFDRGAEALLDQAHVQKGAGVVKTSAKAAFLTAAKTRQWEREKTLRMLA